MTGKIVTMMCGFIAASSFTHGMEIHVHPGGNDANAGTAAKPLATLAAARDKARASVGKEPVTVHIADGIYYLPETLVFIPADSGSAANPVIYKAENEGGAVLSGGSSLDLQWQAYKDGIFQATTPKGLDIDQLFINGKSQRMARYPNYDASKKAVAYQGYAADAFSKQRAAGWSDPTGGYIHAMHRARWGGYHYRITGKDAKGDVTYEGGWQNNRQMGMHKEFRMVENIFEELDAPGEWFHNAKTSTIYFNPEAGTDISKATVEVVRLRHLVEFQGSENAAVKHIVFQGFKVRHAARTFMDCKEQLLRSDWAIYRGGAFMLTGTEDVRILDCEFDQLGGNAIFVNNYNRRTLVKGCHIHDAGASGVCFVGDPNAVRNPLFEYDQKNDLSKIDRTPGPKTKNYPSHGIVEDCLIHGIGRVERQPAGVQIEMAAEITVRDCSIYDTARAGINIGDGAWGGHLIERCDVFDTVLETHDHGSFNSWGRDRYWRSDVKPTQEAVDADPTLPFLDAVKTTTIRDSRWRCDHGWDIDLDDGSSNYDLYNNLMLNTGLKLREGFRRHAWNNVAPFGSLHPHVWYHGSKDQVYANIFATGHRPARMSRPYVDGTMVDRNFFIHDHEKTIKSSAKLGWDKNSIGGDPMFINPTKGDFRVKEDSPALKTGFKNFPMDQFGVKKSSLKAIARTPEIPVLAAKKSKGHGTKPPVAKAPMKSYWLGAKLQELKGGEYSAFGVSKEDGGIALVEVPEDSEARHLGFEENDLIQGVNQHKVTNLRQWFAALAKVGPDALKVKTVRNQKSEVMPVSGNSYMAVETSDTANGFKNLTLPSSTGHQITTNQKTGNEPASMLTDGKLAKNYGTVFANGIKNGAYRMDLGSAKPVVAITGWSYKMGNRGVQKVTFYGSNCTTDPGWNLDDRSRFQPLGSIDTSGVVSKSFTAASLRAAQGKSLGTFRWVVWSVAPVSSVGGGENTAFQELAVELVSDKKSSALPVQKARVSAQASVFPGEKSEGKECARGSQDPMSVVDGITENATRSMSKSEATKEVNPYAVTANKVTLAKPATLKIDPAGITVLSPNLGKLSAGIRPEVRNYMVLWCSATPGDSRVEWTVDAPADGVYGVIASVEGKGSSLTVSGNGQIQKGSVTATGWHRLELGNLPLVAGENKILLEIDASKNKFGKRSQGLLLSAIELAQPAVREAIRKEALAMRKQPDWFKDAGYGLMFQWTNRATPPKGPTKDWESKVNDFDLDGFIKLVDDSGAAYVIWSMTWGNQYISAPVKSLDAIIAGRTTKRDLLGEMTNRLHEKGIKVIFYYHYGYECYHSQDTDWLKAAGGQDADKTRLYKNVMSILSEVGTRYGEKLDGWWFDGGARYLNCHFDGTSGADGILTAPFKEITAAARAGNSKRMVAYNSWIKPLITDYQDYYGGEGKKSFNPTQLTEGVFNTGLQQGLQAHGCFILEKRWGHIDLNTPIPKPKFNLEQLMEFVTRAKHGRYPVSINLEMYEDGSVSPASYALLKELKAASHRIPGK
ncbi:MAG: right-handed parallel beta-helix repeat-containing protein [Akkermansiaceae bacterium]|nr:right-handed parallel beta-helix repeat-containing protein [Akkermansiaceae bacterium]